MADKLKASRIITPFLSLVILEEGGMILRTQFPISRIDKIDIWHEGHIYAKGATATMTLYVGDLVLSEFTGAPRSLLQLRERVMAAQQKLGLFGFDYLERNAQAKGRAKVDKAP